MLFKKKNLTSVETPQIRVAYIIAPRHFPILELP